MRLQPVQHQAMQAGELVAQAQDDANVTYAHKIEKTEAAIDWTQPADALALRIRAFNPFPGCYTAAGSVTLKIWQGSVSSAVASAAPGTVMHVDGHGVVVACGKDALTITELQKPGGKRLPAKSFLAGFPIKAGDRLQ